MVGGEDNSICPKCKTIVEDAEEGLQCDAFCDKLHHIKCVNINSKEYKKIKELGDVDGFVWYAVITQPNLEIMRKQVNGAEDYRKPCNDAWSIHHQPSTNSWEALSRHNFFFLGLLCGSHYRVVADRETVVISLHKTYMLRGLDKIVVEAIEFQDPLNPFFTAVPDFTVSMTR
ncbi:hypothetical protein J6590_027695 [Homalodisca vitripennis]|nr:hypothetical protein J6590_027695 [Homalodisca vitripennis]